MRIKINLLTLELFLMTITECVPDLVDLPVIFISKNLYYSSK